MLVGNLAWAFSAAEAEQLFHVQEFSNYLLIHEEERQRNLRSPLKPGDFVAYHGKNWIVTDVDHLQTRLLQVTPPHTVMRTHSGVVNELAVRTTLTEETENRILRRLDLLLPQSLRLPTGPYPGQRFY